MWGRSSNRELAYLIKDYRFIREKVIDLMADVAQVKADFEAAVQRIADQTSKQINDAIVAAQANFASAQSAALDALDAEINAVAQTPAPVVTQDTAQTAVVNVGEQNSVPTDTGV